MSRFLATQVGAIKYPPYTVSPREERSHAAFDTRADLLAYEAALRSAQALEDCLQADDWPGAADALAPAWEAIKGGDHMRVRWSVPGGGCSETVALGGRTAAESAAVAAGEQAIVAAVASAGRPRSGHAHEAAAAGQTVAACLAPTALRIDLTCDLTGEDEDVEAEGGESREAGAEAAQAGSDGLEPGAEPSCVPEGDSGAGPARNGYPVSAEDERVGVSVGGCAPAAAGQGSGSRNVVGGVSLTEAAAMEAEDAAAAAAGEAEGAVSTAAEDLLCTVRVPDAAAALPAWGDATGRNGGGVAPVMGAGKLSVGAGKSSVGLGKPCAAASAPQPQGTATATAEASGISAPCIASRDCLPGQQHPALCYSADGRPATATGDLGGREHSHASHSSSGSPWADTDSEGVEELGPAVATCAERHRGQATRPSAAGAAAGSSGDAGQNVQAGPGGALPQQACVEEPRGAKPLYLARFCAAWVYAGELGRGWRDRHQHAQAWAAQGALYCRPKRTRTLTLCCEDAIVSLYPPSCWDHTERCFVRLDRTLSVKSARATVV